MVVRCMAIQIRLQAVVDVARNDLAGLDALDIPPANWPNDESRIFSAKRLLNNCRERRRSSLTDFGGLPLGDVR